MIEYKKVLVTGAGRGIGRAIALRLAREGASVAVHYNSSRSAADTVVNEIARAGGTAVAIAADLANATDALELAHKASDLLGGLDGVIFNAAQSSAQSIFDLTLDDIDQVIQVNLRSTLLISKSSLRIMRENRCGALVYIGSTAGQVGGILAGTHYSATKAAIHCIMKSVALAAAPYGVRVNGVAPGFVQTDGLQSTIEARSVEHPEDLVPIKRIGRPEEIAGVVSFLLSQDASYLHGSLIDVNGGLFQR